jgi:hypothetical protein
MVRSRFPPRKIERLWISSDAMVAHAEPSTSGAERLWLIRSDYLWVASEQLTWEARKWQTASPMLHSPAYETRTLMEPLTISQGLIRSF